ncbi:hypothetical protein EDD21DRAFT_184522 [Dissophora ornata]|nr:hypothetical protein EDD21DRAFT_184522 [Dissophora ornata]
MEENIAEHPDPEKGIEPLRVRADPRVKNKRGHVEMIPPSAQTVDMHIKCLVNLYHQQCADPSFPAMTLQLYPNPRKYLAVVKDVYENRLNRVKASEDINSIGLAQSNTSASLRQLMRAAWVRSFVVLGKKGQRKRNSLRDRLDICWLRFMMCRRESTRKARLPDLLSHEPSQEAALTDGSWTGFHLVSGNDKMLEISNTAQYLAHKAIMEQANVKDRKKVTHRGRIHGSQFTQACGTSVKAIAQHGNWAHNRLSTHYLSRVDASVALHMAGFNPPNERLWLPRNTSVPPMELQRLVFHFIEEQFPGDQDWSLLIENVMLDRDVFHGRQIPPPQVKAPGPRRRHRTDPRRNECGTGNASDDGRNADDDDGDDEVDDNDDDGDDEGEQGGNIIAKRRHLILLAHLRKVVLQDAAVLMDLGDRDEQCRYLNHHVFQHSVFKTQLFLDYRARLRREMLSATPPITDSLVANAPGICSRLRAVESQVLDLGRIIESELGNSRMTRETNDRSIQVLASTTNKAVKASLNDIRKDIQEFRMDTAHNNEVALGVMNRVASQVRLIIEEELHPLLQQQTTSQLRASTTILDIDTNLDMDLDLVVPDASPCTIPAIAPAQPDAQHELTAVQPATNDSASSELLLEPPEPSASRAPLSLENIELLMAMISATATPPTKPVDMPAYKMLPRDSSLEDLWQEWFHGVNGNPSILQLNMWFNTS